MSKTATSPVLVLGGHGDIGAAICRRFTEAGHDVIATGSAEMDLSDPASIDAWFKQPRPAFGILVHSAGLNVPRAFEEMTDEDVNKSFAVNITGFLRVMRHILPGLIAAKGQVVALSSIYGFLARTKRLPYVAAKHALIGCVQALALDMAPQGVRVNAVSPGYIDTKMTRKNLSPETIATLTSQIPAGRMGAPSDIAEVVYFLCTPASRYINGQDIVVDGGFSIDGARGTYPPQLLE